MMKFVPVALAEPGALTSAPVLVTTTLEVLAALGRRLFTLFDHPAPRVADGLAGRGVADCGAAAATPMREASLREGALLLHLRRALFTLGARTALSQQLVASWCDAFAPALQQILPPGLVTYLNVPKAQPVLLPAEAQGPQL
jgi:DnaJ family protein C protein 13